MTLLAALIIFIMAIVLFFLAKNDLKNYILPDYLNASLGILFLVFHGVTHWQSVSIFESVCGAAGGAGLLLFVRCIADKFYRKDSLGLGDVKLIAAGGLGLGFPDIFLALSLGALIGLLHGVLMWQRQKKKHPAVRFDEINVPAGLGLVLGIAIVFSIFTLRTWLEAQ